MTLRNALLQGKQPQRITFVCVQDCDPGNTQHNATLKANFTLHVCSCTKLRAGTALRNATFKKELHPHEMRCSRIE